MAGKLAKGEIKIEAAKKAVAEILEQLPAETILAFRAYGHQSPREKHDCQDTQLLEGFNPLSENRKKILDRLPGIQAKGYTPITYVLQKAAEDFPADFSEEKMIVLVSDGKETCEGDPCATALALAKSNPRLVIHTVGFGVDAAAKSQLECIAKASGGKYFSAEDALQLATVINQAVRTSASQVVEEKGDGWLEIKRADFSGHEVTKAETGEKVAVVNSLQSVVQLPAGVYNVAFGQAVWKSVKIEAKKKTVLEPGSLRLTKASLSGHEIIEKETGILQGVVNSLKNTLTLIPGEYLVMFGKSSWEIIVEGGKEVVLNPGTVTVLRADIYGHKIYNKAGELVGEVSQIESRIPLPPGDYVIEIDGQKISFSLKEGEDLTFERK